MTCKVCGCTDDWGCDEGCGWIEHDICSSCADAFESEGRWYRPDHVVEVRVTFGTNVGSVSVPVGLGDLESLDELSCIGEQLMAEELLAAA